jgi:Glycosyltransferase Family 4
MEFIGPRNLDAKMAAVKGRILALSGMMPPLVFPRALQISRSLKTLHKFGWDTTVVTILPDAELNAMQDSQFAKLYEGCFNSLFVDTREEVVPSSLWRRLWRKIKPPVDLKTDNWLLRAEAVLRREIAQDHYDVLLTFAQPWVNHLIGLRIKRRYPSIPWCVHFSDPWVDSPYFDLSEPKLVDRARLQERNVIDAADIVMFVNHQTADLVMAKYPNSWRAKVHIVPHGYDSDLLNAIPSNKEQTGKMRIVYTGNFYGLRNPGLFLQAIVKLVEDTEIRELLHIEFVGNTGEEFVALATELGLTDCVFISGKARYLASLEIAASADLLLIIDAPAQHNVFLPSKIVDYLMLKKPIFGITPMSGATADALRELECPIVAPDDPQMIADELRKIIERWRMGQLAVPDKTQAKAFDICETTLEMEKAIIQAVKNSCCRK